MVLYQIKVLTLLNDHFANEFLVKLCHCQRRETPLNENFQMSIKPDPWNLSSGKLSMGETYCMNIAAELEGGE